MNKYIETTGKTEEDAISTALEQLNMDRDEVSVEVVERAKSGFLGIGGSPAVVRVYYEQIDSKAQKVEDFLSGLFSHMEINANAEISEEETDTIRVVLTGGNPGALIGRRGETLDAIQHLTNYVVNSSSADRVRIYIDAENYRERRNESLIRLANKMADKVLKYRRNMTLEPMNSYERHVIHTALQERDGITTFSTGVEPGRRIVIASEKQQDAPPKYNSSREWR